MAPKKEKIQPYTGLGAQQFDISDIQFIEGMTTANELHDGGFSNKSYNINPIANKGNIGLQFPPEFITPPTYQSGETLPIATCGPNVLGEAVFVGNSGSYFLYSYNSGSVTLIKEQGDSYYLNYSAGVTDMVYYELFSPTQSMYFTSTSEDITTWDGSGTSGSTHFNNSFWIGTLGQTGLSLASRHPLLVGPTNWLYIGDGPVLRSFNTSNVVTTNPLTLSSNQEITALGIDPSSGKMLVGVSMYGSGISEELMGGDPQYSYIGIYDGVNPVAFLKMCPVDAPINAFWNVGGNCIVSYGNKLGIWNGQGITYLRTLNISYTQGQAMNKQKACVIDNTIYFAENENVLAYGEIQAGGPKVFYYPSQNPTGSGYGISCLSNLGYGILGIGSSIFNVSVASPTVYVMPTTGIYAYPSGGTSTGYFYSTKYNMPRRTFVRAIDVILDKVPTNGTHAFTWIDDQGNTRTFTNNTIGTSSNKVQRMTYSGTYSTSIQILDTMTNCDASLRRVIVYYDLEE